MNRALLALALISALVSGARANECVPQGAPMFRETVPTVGEFYADHDACFSTSTDPCSPLAVWVYQESNGIEGLQRGDALQDDTCSGAIQADTLIIGASVFL